MADRSADIVSVVNDLRSRVARLEALGAGRWGVADTRVEVRLRRAATQSINSGSLTAISWDTEDVDPDGFASGSTVTVPAGFDAVYTITLYVDMAFAGGAGIRCLSEIVVTSAVTGIGSKNYRFPATNEEEFAAAITIPLAAGDSFVCNVFHNQGTAQDLTKALLEMVKVAP